MTPFYTSKGVGKAFFWSLGELPNTNRKLSESFREADWDFFFLVISLLLRTPLL